jgi:hypothetical protein
VTQTQDYDAAITWTQDWAKHLTLNGNLTITTATATCADIRVTVDDATVTDAGTSVTFRVSQSGITSPTVVVVTVAVALSNGDTDERDLGIQFTNT